MDYTEIQKLREKLDQKTSIWKLILFGSTISAFFLFTEYVIIGILLLATVILPVLLKRLSLKNLGIELVTLTMVLIAIQFGSAAGAISGFVLMAAHMVAAQHSGSYILWVIPSYALAGFLAGVLTLGITQLGIALAVGLNSLFIIFTAISAPGRLTYTLPHFIGNVLLNIVIFASIAPRILGLM